MSPIRRRSAARRAQHVGPEQSGTSHFSIVDADGNAVSMTTTIETGFGSRLMVGGFLLNNELTDFSRSPESNGRPVANRVEGGKRPRSSMAPTIVLKDGRPYLVLGSPGGSRIINYVAKTIVAVHSRAAPVITTAFARRRAMSEQVLKFGFRFLQDFDMGILIENTF